MNPLGRPEISLDHRQQFTLPALSLEDDSVDRGTMGTVMEEGDYEDEPKGE